MTPYTIDAVKLIRNEIGQGQPPAHVRDRLGWDSSFFERVCQRHGIAVAADDQSMRPSPPAASSASAKSARGLVHVIVALPPDIVARIDKYAERAGVSRHRASGSIVSEYVATVPPARVEFVARAEYRSAKSAIVVNVGLDEADWQAIDDESCRRNSHRASVGMFVKTILVRYFEFESVASR